MTNRGIDLRPGFGPLGPLAVAAGVLLGAALPLQPAAAQETDGATSGIRSSMPHPDSLDDTPRMTWDPNDPRIGLAPGWHDAESAILNLEHLATVNKPVGFVNPDDPGDRRFNNTDLAFQGHHLFQGNYHGFQIFDIADPTDPELLVSVVCPGGQGDVSIYRNLLFMSAQETRGRLDCGTEGVEDSVSTDRLRGIRIFDISDVRRPRQVAAIQSCRGSHTHTFVPAPSDPDHVYVYIQGTNSPRPVEEMEGCIDADPEENPETALFRIEVVRVPLARPQDAAIVSEPRIFADPETGDIAGLWEGGLHGPGTQDTRRTDRCHDITVFPEMGLAGGACSGNGILLDISDPVSPVRVDEVIDPNFSYWHSATFNNDADKLVFTDEWGGGSSARCRPSDPDIWGGNAIFRVRNRKMELAGYYKLPVPQTEAENCVAHNGSIIPVPGRDLMVQAWYQGGLSLMDFTDPEHPVEIAFFDRGPLPAADTLSGGYWSTYWYNGRIYGAEISRGIDVFRLTPSEFLSEAEIAAAEMVKLERFNAQTQPRVTWPDAVPVARAYLQQMVRNRRILNERADAVEALLDRAEAGRASDAELLEMAETLESDLRKIRVGELGGDAGRMEKLAGVLRGLAG